MPPRIRTVSPAIVFLCFNCLNIHIYININKYIYVYKTGDQLFSPLWLKYVFNIMFWWTCFVDFYLEGKTQLELNQTLANNLKNRSSIEVNRRVLLTRRIPKASYLRRCVQPASPKAQYQSVCVCVWNWNIKCHALHPAFGDAKIASEVCVKQNNQLMKRRQCVHVKHRTCHGIATACGPCCVSFNFTTFSTKGTGCGTVEATAEG